ncbi:MAG: hypothetical protein L0191_03545 [Acidobacteria bacterium]|nr:hypothetical protein [Acidobacteriota bacterium]
MEPLFDLELEHTGKAELAPQGPKEGTLVGAGEGKVLGPRVKGKLRWTLYENSTNDGCTMQLPGEIVTEDGDRVSFEGQGHAVVPNQGEPSKWKVGGAFRFHTADRRYEWLNAVLALWVGEFDMSTGRARYRLYLPTDGAGNKGWRGGGDPRGLLQTSDRRLPLPGVREDGAEGHGEDPGSPGPAQAAEGLRR